MRIRVNSVLKNRYCGFWSFYFFELYFRNLQGAKIDFLYVFKTIVVNLTWLHIIILHITLYVTLIIANVLLCHFYEMMNLYYKTLLNHSIQRNSQGDWLTFPRQLPFLYTVLFHFIGWKYSSCIKDINFRINFRCWKISSYTYHVRQVACDDVTISRALFLYKITITLLGSGRKQ